MIPSLNHVSLKSNKHIKYIFFLIKHLQSRFFMPLCQWQADGQRHYGFWLSVWPISVTVLSQECFKGFFFFQFGTKLHFVSRMNWMNLVVKGHTKHIFSPNSRIQMLIMTKFHNKQQTQSDTLSKRSAATSETMLILFIPQMKLYVWNKSIHFSTGLVLGGGAALTCSWAVNTTDYMKDGYISVVICMVWYGKPPPQWGGYML